MQEEQHKRLQQQLQRRAQKRTVSESLPSDKIIHYRKPATPPVPSGDTTKVTQQHCLIGDFAKRSCYHQPPTRKRSLSASLSREASSSTSTMKVQTAPSSKRQHTEPAPSPSITNLQKMLAKLTPPPPSTSTSSPSPSHPPSTAGKSSSPQAAKPLLPRVPKPSRTPASKLPVRTRQLLGFAFLC